MEVAGKSLSERLNVLFDLCSDGFFRTLGLHLLQGRLLSGHDIDSAQRVAVVNEAFARTLLNGADPVGQKIKFKVFDLIPDAPHDAYFEIIGVVNNISNQGLRDSPGPEAYLPYTMFATLEGNLLVKTSSDPVLVAKHVRDVVLSADPTVSVADASSLQFYLRRYDYATPEFGLATLGAFAGIGLMLLTVGIFGVMAYTVSLRTQEFGIRMALGAQRKDILRMVLSKGSALIAAGILLGLLASYALTRFLASQIWGISPTYTCTFGSVIILVVFVALTACLLPARRAARVDPLIALRYE